MKPENRRRFHRIDFDGTVNVQFAHRSYDCCQVKNLSLTGMFVKGKFKRKQVDDCRVKVFHKEPEGNNCLQALGRVVWRSEEGVGLTFTSMSFEDYMLLQTTLRDKADEPEVVLREFPQSCPFEITS